MIETAIERYMDKLREELRPKLRAEMELELREELKPEVREELEIELRLESFKHIARTMLAKGFDTALIAEATGMTPSEIEDLHTDR